MQYAIGNNKTQFLLKMVLICNLHIQNWCIQDISNDYNFIYISLELEVVCSNLQFALIYLFFVTFNFTFPKFKFILKKVFSL